VDKHKYYVVWKGRKTGIFTTWAECEKQVKGFVGAQYKAFGSSREAEAAFLAKYDDYKGKPASHGKWKTAETKPVLPSICVDAACSGSPGKVEYRGVITETGEQIFHAGPYEQGTNNVGEFLAIVHALTWQFKHNSHTPFIPIQRMPLFGDERHLQDQSPSHQKNALLFALIHSAENWLAENELPEDKILKWDTELWGENPADFGRK